MKRLILGIMTLAVLAADASGALNVVMADPNHDYFDDGTDPCPRGDGNDDCYVRSYLHLKDVGSDEFVVFRDAWNAWNDDQLPDQKWDLLWGDPLEGYLWITKFDTFNKCPKTGGVQIRADFFSTSSSNPTDLQWVQGVRTNYPLGLSVLEHEDAIGTTSSYMDIKDEVGYAEPPLYPIQHADGHFYDKPERVCVEDEAVLWDAVAMLAVIDRPNRTLRLYGGINYGFVIACESVPDEPRIVPEPHSMLTWSLLGAIACLVCHRRKN